MDRRASEQPARAEATSPQAAQPTEVQVVGAHAPVPCKGQDSWNMVDTPITLPESLWDATADKGDTTECHVTHFLGQFKFPNGRKHPAYTVTFGGAGEHYAVRADTIARFAPPDRRRALRKQGAPRQIVVTADGQRTAHIV